jgi:AraC-like DNA-binding protein
LGYNANKLKEYRKRGMKEDSGSAKLTELLREFIFDRVLQQEEIEMLPEEEKLFAVPFWESGICLNLLMIRDGIRDAIGRASLYSLIDLVKIHAANQPVDWIGFRGKAIILYYRSRELDYQQWLQWKERLNNEIQEMMGCMPSWRERIEHSSWRNTRRSLNQSLLNFQMHIGEKSSLLVKNALVNINEHFHEGIGLDQIANMAGVTPSYFSRLFKQETGESFVHYISALRIDKAKELLLKENHTVAFVGNQIGYSNQRYFMKWFKETTGWTPGEFRRLHGR